MSRARSLLALTATALSAHATAAFAQTISDPTRPPPGWLLPDPKGAKPEAKVEAGSGGEPVQLLLVGKTRRYAIVRGEIVGEKTPGTKLVEVQRNEVVVSGERGNEKLAIFPDVEKTPPKKPPGMGKKEQK